MKLATATLGVLAAASSSIVRADGPSAIGYASVAAALRALQSDPASQFAEQSGWTVVASRENGNAVQWFFTPDGHPAHPSVVKRTIAEQDGTGYVDLVVLCHVRQDTCDRLLDDFKQVSAQPQRTVVAEQVTLDVGIALNDHDRVRVSRLVTEEGKAAEIRMDDLFKLVIVPMLDEVGSVMLWTAMYEFDGSDYRLVSEPRFAVPGEGTAEIRLASASGNKFDFSITPLAAER